MDERPPVTTVADARAGISETLRRFRASRSADPVVLGSHRKPEAVLLPYGEYRRLVDADTPTTVRSVLDDVRSRGALVRRLAHASHIRGVAVFGSVARGEERPDSDIDLLVDPTEEATLFDLAQFAIDLEQLFGRKIDVISRESLLENVDQQIIADAVSI